jgi:hypothetical protein
MRNKLINKRAILLLAAIFLLSLSSYAPPKKGGKNPPELYKVTISINGSGPGLENWNNEVGPVCGSLGHFYAESQGGKNDLLKIESEGSATPGLDGEVAPLNMWVTTGIETPIYLEECLFNDGCHSENEYSKIVIRFLTSQDMDGTDPDIVIHLWVDYEKVPSNETKGSKKLVRGFRLRTLMPYDEGDYPLPTSSELFPEGGLDIGGTFWTDVTGNFVLLHDGKACPGGIEGEDFLEVLEDFNIRLFIERVQ